MRVSVTARCGDKRGREGHERHLVWRVLGLKAVSQKHGRQPAKTAAWTHLGATVATRLWTARLLPLLALPKASTTSLCINLALVGGSSACRCAMGVRGAAEVQATAWQVWTLAATDPIAAMVRAGGIPVRRPRSRARLRAGLPQPDIALVRGLSEEESQHRRLWRRCLKHVMLLSLPAPELAHMLFIEQKLTFDRTSLRICAAVAPASMIAYDDPARPRNDGEEDAVPLACQSKSLQVLLVVPMAVDA